MKTIFNGKRYDTANAKVILKVQYPDTNVDQLWLTKKGAWLIESTIEENEKKENASLYLYSSEEALEFLENAQYYPSEFLPHGINSQSIVDIIEKFFADKIENE